MSGQPQGLNEWAEYIATLAGEPLFSQAAASNSQAFSSMLLDEGYSMADVEQIMLLFVRQLRATGTKVPEGGPWDLPLMAQIDPVARRGATMTEEEAALLESQFHPSIDEFDTFELEAAADF